MAAQDAALLSVNAGEVSRFALARIDLAKLKIACQVESNVLPHVLGPAFVRPGTAFRDHTRGDTTSVRFLEFYYSASVKALLVLTPLFMRIMVNGVYVTRVSVASAITNGNFDANLTSWTQSDEAGATSAWAAGGFMSLLGTGTNYAFRDQQITVAAPDVNKEHALRVIVHHGTVRLQVGGVLGDNSYIDQTLAEGAYSLAFTPGANFWIRLGSNTAYPSYVDSIQVEAAGIVELPTPWDTGDLANVFYDQSADVLFVAGGATIRQRRIERRGVTTTDLHSWGVAVYYTDDGPFRAADASGTTITPSATTGNTTLTASRGIWASSHVGALYRLQHQGQTATASLASGGATTGNIRISGLTSHNFSVSSRIFAIDISGTFVATIVLERSLGSPGSWTVVKTWTAPTSETYDDGLDNQIIYYRLRASAYTSGAAVSSLNYAGSIQIGIARITDFSSPTVVQADILAQFGATTATSTWSEGEWSTYRGFPTAVSLHDGRLFWEGGIKIWGSISDGFSSFDDTVTGDSGTINRAIATGGLDGARWSLSLQRLLVGTAGQEISIRSSAFDEPLTPTAFVARACSTRGAAKVRALRVDTQGIFVERNGQRIFELAFDLQKGDYASKELTRLKQEMCAAGVKSLAVQRQPDTRMWFPLNDGTAVVLTYEFGEDVSALTQFTTPSGTIQEVAVLPGTDEDEVYFAVQRGASCFVEQLAKRSEAGIGAISKCMDCHVFAAGPTASVGFSHMPDGTSVVAWANGVPLPGPFTVSGGNVALGGTFSNVTVGLAFTAQIQTAKLAFAAERGTPLEMQKRVARVGLVMADVAWKGVRIGRNFSNLSGLPATYRGKALAATDTLAAYDAVPGSFNGGWDSDARVCIQISSPYPATIMGLVLDMETNEPNEPPPPPRDGR